MSETAQCTDADVFVSYSSHDRDRVMSIVRRLQSAGIGVWIDHEKIDGATRWAAEIVRAIEACKVFLLMCSDASMRSWAVTQEIQLAGERQKRLLPLLLEKSAFPEQMQFFLAGVQWIELLDCPSSIWMPQIIGALARAGVRSSRAGGEAPTGASSLQPSRLVWSLDGLRSLARFTDQLWAFPADRPMPNAGRSLMRGLGEAQTGAQHAFRIGSRVRIGIESELNGHLLLLDEGPEGRLYCLCPSHFARDTRLPKGTSILPHSRSIYDAFVLTGVPGREQLLAIVTDDPLDFEWMPSDSVSPARVLNQNDIDALLKTLQMLPPGSWTTLSTYFDVVPDR